MIYSSNLVIFISEIHSWEIMTTSDCTGMEKFSARAFRQYLIILNTESLDFKVSFEDNLSQSSIPIVLIIPTMVMRKIIKSNCGPSDMKFH